MASEHWDLDQDNTLGGNSPSPNKSPSQKAIKEYVDASTGSTVDQTYDPTSTNAQSGVAIAGAGFLKNTATGTNSLTLLGTATSSNLAINIGYNSSAGGGNIAIGTLANTNGAGAIAIGRETEASAINTLAIGNTAKATANNAIQIGYGTNNTANKFKVRSHELLDLATGLIPDARISSNIARTSDIPSITVDQTYDSTSANAQSGVAIAGAGFLTSIPSNYLQNTATATNSLTILGTTNNQNNSILIGYSTTTSSTNSTVIGNTAVSGGSYATALGYYARANDQYTTAIGNSSYASYQDTTAVGHNSQATAAGTLAVGSNSKATAQRATSIGYSSQATQYQATALGYEAKATANSALQIGTGTNSTANTLQVGSYTLLNTSTGLIPDARISSNIARTSAIPDISTKQDTLVSGTNIKTINDISILGSGNINSLVTVSYGSTYFIELRDLLSLSRDVVCVKDSDKIAHLRTMNSSYFEFVYNDKNSTEIWKIDEYDNWTTVSVSHANTTLSNVSSIDSSSAVATALDEKVNTSDIWYDSTTSTLYIGVAQT